MNYNLLAWSFKTIGNQEKGSVLGEGPSVKAHEGSSVIVDEGTYIYEIAITRMFAK